ncbi:MYND-type domain-containing protein [Mycena indigotica]|uniref:MYND-type domain-containing protein n=1 Tax=Mycena indigotica TaxID=2126181 RepID=A0A8H6VR56_9AGAR|nr:MYND-type domain-containing protein [Mycena indigotica]KAF7288961.1 MYND-type domain-containing protein [Mycena indigotica]
MSRTVPHPDLQLARLELLPLRPRLLARRVCVRDCPHNAIEAFKAILDELPPGSREATHMLPALFFLMDPANIPPAEEVAELAPSAEAAMADGAAYLAFFLEKVDPMKTAAYTALWLRLLLWVDFFNTYGSVVAATRMRLSRTFVRIFMVHGADAWVTDLRGLQIPSIWNDRRFSFLLGQELTAIFESKSIAHEPISLAVEARALIFTFIDLSRHNGVYDMDIPLFLEGAGGARRWGMALGRALRTVTRLWSGPNRQPQTVTEHTMTCLDVFILATRTTVNLLGDDDDDDDDDEDDDYGKFIGALRDANYAAGLTSALGILALPPSATVDEDIYQETQHQCLLLLRVFLTSEPSSGRLQSAASRGLLSSLVALARSARGYTDFENNVQEIIRDVLLPELVDPQIVKGLADDIRDNNIEQSLHQVSSPELRYLLSTLITRVKPQAEYLLLWNMREERNHRLCDGIGCPVNDKKELRACSVCGFRYYCSPACQRSDWTTGNHREMCDKYCDANTELQDWTTPTSRSFVRFLMAQEYSRDHSTAALGRPAVAVFDYRDRQKNLGSDTADPRPFVSGAYFTSLRDAAPLLEGILDNNVWADYCARATADEGFGIGWNICITQRQNNQLAYIHRVLRMA